MDGGSFSVFSPPKNESSSVNPNLLSLRLFFVQSYGQELTSMAWCKRSFPRNGAVECIRDRLFAVDEGMPLIFASPVSLHQNGIDIWLEC